MKHLIVKKKSDNSYTENLLPLIDKLNSYFSIINSYANIIVNYGLKFNNYLKAIQNHK